MTEFIGKHVTVCVEFLHCQTPSGRALRIIKRKLQKDLQGRLMVQFQGMDLHVRPTFEAGTFNAECDTNHGWRLP